MWNTDKLRTGILYGVILLAIGIKIFFPNAMVILIMGMIILGCCLGKEEKRNRSRGKIEKVKVVLILVAFYYIIYLLLGLLVGYQSSPYSLKISEVIKNSVWLLGLPLIYEMARSRLVQNADSWISYSLITILFTLLTLDYREIQGLINVREIIEYGIGYLLVVFVQSSLLTFLSVNGGYVLNYAYTIPVSLSTILLPVFPNLDWFVDSTLKYILYLFIFLFMYYEDHSRIKKKSRKQIKREAPFRTIPIVLFMVLVVGFVAGFFPYKPVAVISNSMVPNFARGDICIIRKITDYEQIKQIQEGDIIEYQLNEIFILHRVIEIQQTGYGYRYITKGDHNETQDLLPVEENQVLGKVTYTIPYIGYPSVWFSEFLAKVSR